MKARTIVELDAEGGGKQPIGTVHEGPNVHFLLGITDERGQPVAEPLDDEAEASVAYWAGLRAKARAGIVKAAAAALAQREEEAKLEERSRLAEFENQLKGGT